MIIVSLIGLKKSGKTTCVEALVKEFKARGMKVGTVKSMVHSKFTIDTEGKDTWRHQQAGADFVISLSKSERAYIEKREINDSLKDALELVPEDCEILICEGLDDDDPRILKVILARSPELLEETFDVRGVKDGVIALSGIMANETKEHDEYPVFNCTKAWDVGILADLIIKCGCEILPKKERQLMKRKNELDILRKKLKNI